MAFLRLTRAISLTVIVLTCICAGTYALENGLARTPPMGWNPWSAFGGRITEAVFRATADSMDSKGLRAAGYIYMNQDGGGSYPNQKATADYLHARGFKFGVYGNDVNYSTPESTWVARWKSWDADYVKWDAYNTAWNNVTFTLMRDLLEATGRDIVYSAHCTAETMNATVPTIANLWRTGPDIYVGTDGSPSWIKIVQNGYRNAGYASYSVPGFWCDPDFLLVGFKDALTVDEEKSHFSLWCISSSPLIIAADVRTIRRSSLDILLNTEIIAVNQDSLGLPVRNARRITPDSTDVWVKVLKNGDRAVLMNSRSNTAKRITARWSDVGLTGSVTVRDLWAHRDLGTFVDSFTVQSVPAHGCVFLRVKGTAITMAPGIMAAQRATASAAAWTIVNPLGYRAPVRAATAFDIQGRNAVTPLTRELPVLCPLVLVKPGADGNR